MSPTTCSSSSKGACQCGNPRDSDTGSDSTVGRLVSEPSLTAGSGSAGHLHARPSDNCLQDCAETTRIIVLKRDGWVVQEPRGTSETS